MGGHKSQHTVKNSQKYVWGFNWFLLWASSNSNLPGGFHGPVILGHEKTASGFQECLYRIYELLYNVFSCVDTFQVKWDVGAGHFVSVYLVLMPQTTRIAVTKDIQHMYTHWVLGLGETLSQLHSALMENSVLLDGCIFTNALQQSLQVQLLIPRAAGLLPNQCGPSLCFLSL